MTRHKVLDIVLEAIEMARVISDPTAMLQGAQELNRMCGAYAPEKKEREQKDGRDRVRRELALMSRFAALVPRPRLHLIRFHGVLAPNAKLRAEIIPSAPVNANDT